jgi:ribonuclease HI
MRWVRSDFKGTEVWAEVNDEGRPSVVGGRRAIRYSDAPGARVYRATAAGLRDLGGEVREIAEGVVAGGGGAARGSGFGKAGTRSAGQSEAAAADAKARLAALPADTVVAFTDGACTGNPGPAGSGVVLRFADGRTVERHRALGEATNNIGELTAVGMALELLREEEIDRSAPVAVFTDSQYAIGVLAKGWKAKANVGLIAGLKRSMVEWPNLQLHWVAGHVGVPENERADALARRGVDESRRGR